MPTTVALLLAAVAASAAELPPKVAPPFTAVYQSSSRGRHLSSDPWIESKETITISVRDKKSRWEHKESGIVTIVDSAAPNTIRFGGTIAPNTAVRSKTQYTGIGWEFGIATIAADPEAKAEVLGTSTIAGHECTRVRYTSEHYGEPEFCVDKTGIVLRFANRAPDAETSYEATSVDETAPDAAKFSVPEGYTVEEGRTLKRHLDF